MVPILSNSVALRCRVAVQVASNVQPQLQTLVRTASLGGTSNF
jgi:hypothetical protein